MKTFIADIFPKIKRFSKKLDNLTILTNQHWILIDNILSIKTVFIFRDNNELLVSTNGKVDKAKWEYLGKESILIENNNQSYLFKFSFFDNNVIALKIDNSNEYAILVNESCYDSDIRSFDKVIDFLSKKYLKAQSVTVDPIDEDHSTIVLFIIIGVVIMGIVYIFYNSNHTANNYSSTATDNAKIADSLKTADSAAALAATAEAVNSSNNNAATTDTPNYSSSNNNDDNFSTNSSELNSIDEEREQIISSHIEAEMERDIQKIMSFYATNMERYYDLYMPTIEEIKNRYEHIWSILYNDKEKIKGIQKISENTYLVIYDYEYYGREKDTYHKLTNQKVYYVFNDRNEIIRLYDNT